MTAGILLAVVAAWHAAFQLTVTVLVYPTLLAHTDDRFAVAHALHSRRILVLVVPTYAAVLVACGWRLLAGSLDVGSLLAVAAQGAVLAATAFGAAPAHGALGREGLTRSLSTRLRRIDGLRTALALVGLVLALTSL